MKRAKYCYLFLFCHFLGGLSALVKDKRAEAIDREIVKGSSVEDDAINLIKKRGEWHVFCPSNILNENMYHTL